MSFSFSYFTAISASMGEVVLAANAVLMHLQSFMAHALDAFAHAVEALAGSAYGAGRAKQFARALRLTSFWAVIMALLMGLVYLLFGESIIGLFTNIESVKRIAIEYLFWMMISPLVSIWSFQLDGIFIGTGHTREMRNAMIFSTLAFLAILQWTIPTWGNHGLFLGLLAFMLLRAVSLLFYFPVIRAAIKVSESKHA